MNDDILDLHIRTSSISRRRVLATSAWVAPAVVAVTAAPALAASGDKVAFQPGGTAVVNDPGAGSTYDDLQFTGASVVNQGTSGIPAGGLTLTVTFSATTTSGSFTASKALYAVANLAGWTSPAAGTQSASLVYTYQNAVAAGGTVTLPTAIAFGCTYNRSQEQGSFVLSFAATGFTGASAMFATRPVTGSRARYANVAPRP